MRQIFRNFDRLVTTHLRCSDAAAKEPIEGETQDRLTCPACSEMCHCDVFHFFECSNGASAELVAATVKAIEQHAMLLSTPDCMAEQGEGELHIELLWARIVIMSPRMPGVAGRYRRSLAAKVLSGALSPPSQSELDDTRDEWIENGYGSDSPDDDGDDGVGDGDGDDEAAALDSTTSRARKAKTGNDVRWRYAKQACKLNTLCIDNIRAEYDIWLLRVLGGIDALRTQFGQQYQAIDGPVEDIREQQELGMFTPAASGSSDRQAAYPMLLSVFEFRRSAGTLEAGRLVLDIAGDKVSHHHRGNPEDRVPTNRDAAKAAQVAAEAAGKVKYSCIEQEREMGVVLLRPTAHRAQLP
jgi:hypothetical protein